MAATVTARVPPLKVVAVVDPAELLGVPVPDGMPRVELTIRLPQGSVTADLSAKSVRRAIAMVREHGPEVGSGHRPRPAVWEPDRRGGPVGAAEGAEAGESGRAGGVSAPSSCRV
jgi:hypothetical protein